MEGCLFLSKDDNKRLWQGQYEKVAQFSLKFSVGCISLFLLFVWLVCFLSVLNVSM